MPGMWVEFSPEPIRIRAEFRAVLLSHCNQAYYGTDEKGLIHPRAFDCLNCGQHVDLDEMVLMPAAGLEDDQTRSECVPWLERRRKGTIRAWFATIRGSMTRPTRLIRGAPGEGKSLQAWYFSTCTLAMTAISGWGPAFLISFVFAFVASPRAGAANWAMGFGLLFVLVGFVVGTLVGILVWGALTHGLLRVIGNPDGSLKRTYQALCYGSGPMILGAVPCVGVYFVPIGAIWWIVSAVLMVRASQKVDGVRATIAVLAPPGLATSLIILAYAALFYAILTGTGPMAMNFPTPVSETQSILVAMKGFHDERGSLPGHAVELVDAPYLTAGEFTSAFSGTSVTRVPVGGASLGQLDFMRQEARDRVIRAALKGLPPGTVAHRLGDYVFTYHGIYPKKADPGLWLVVASPDPAASSRPAVSLYDFPFAPTSRPSARATIAVGRVDWTVLEIAAGEFAAALEKQNKLRADFNLPPLPDPKTVTHKRPAVATPVSQEN